MALALTAPGSRTNAVNAATPLPDRNGGEAREFQLNVDGQQVSADIGTGGQAKFSADSIAEFQFISNRFDATLGRSTGVQVNAITKSGTQQALGLVPRQLPRQPVQRREPGAATASSRSRTSSTAPRLAARSSRTSCTTSATSSTSASRGRASSTRRTRRSTGRSTAPTTRRRAASASTTSSRRRRA